MQYPRKLKYIPGPDFEPKEDESAITETRTFIFEERAESYTSSSGKSKIKKYAMQIPHQLSFAREKLDSPLNRPHSIAELAKIAEAGKPPHTEFYTDLQTAMGFLEVFIHEAMEDFIRGDKQMAFVNYVRASTILSHMIPVHRGYEGNNILQYSCTKWNTTIQTQLGILKGVVVQQYEAWARVHARSRQPTMDLPHILNTMQARDNEERRIRNDFNRDKYWLETGEHNTNVLRTNDAQPSQSVKLTRQPSQNQRSMPSSSSSYQSDTYSHKREPSQDRYGRSLFRGPPAFMAPQSKEPSQDRYGRSQYREYASRGAEEPRGYVPRSREPSQVRYFREVDVSSKYRDIPQDDSSGVSYRSANKQDTLTRQRQWEEQQLAVEEEQRLAEQKRLKEAEEKRRRDWEEAKRIQEERRKRDEEEARRRVEGVRKKAEEAGRKMEEEANGRAEEQEARRRVEEARRKAAEEEARRGVMEEEARRRAAAEEAKRKAEEEARHKAEEEARHKAEEEARRKAEEEKRKQEGELQRLQERKYAEVEEAKGWEWERGRGKYNKEDDPYYNPPRKMRDSDVRATRERTRQRADSFSDEESSKPPPTIAIVPPPLESLTSPERFDPVSKFYSKGSLKTPDTIRIMSPPITTTTPAPKDPKQRMKIIMTDEQSRQGYAPSLRSPLAKTFLAPPAPDKAVLFQPNPLNGPSRKNLPSSPDRPPAHLRHLWDMQNGISRPPRPPSPNSRIVIPEQIKGDEKDTVLKKGDLAIVQVPEDLIGRFLFIAAVHTGNHKEFAGFLMGKEDKGFYKVTDLVIPKQRNMSDSCLMLEEDAVGYGEERNLITLGWIHTHPNSSCFLTSQDMHMLANYQRHLPEFFAIVCSPNHHPPTGIFRLTDPPGLKRVMTCKDKDPCHSHTDNHPLYTDADSGHVMFVAEELSHIGDLR